MALKPFSCASKPSRPLRCCTYGIASLEHLFGIKALFHFIVSSLFVTVFHPYPLLSGLVSPVRGG